MGVHNMLGELPYTCIYIYMFATDITKKKIKNRYVRLSAQICYLPTGPDWPCELTSKTRLSVKILGRLSHVAAD